MDYKVIFTRIVLSGRIQDKYLAAQCKKIISDQSINKGTTFAVVEIDNPWFSSCQIGQSIINALTREYSKASNSSDLVNFELSLKKVNEALARITQNGETDWIGKLNSCLVLICDNQIHLAKTGKAEAYLIRNNKISSITDDFDQNPEFHPLKTFGDIVSGSLEPGDKIFVTTPEIFNYFSKEGIKQILANNNTFPAANEIANKLKKEKEKNVSAIIIELVSCHESDSYLPDESEEVVYLDQDNPLDRISQDAKSFLNDLTPQIEKVKQFIKNSLKKLSVQWSAHQDKILPATKKIGAQSLEQLKKGHQHLNEKVIPKVVQSLKPISQKISDFSRETLDKNQFISKNFNVKHYTENSKKSLFPIISKIANGFNLIIFKISYALRWLLKPKNRSVLYGLLVLILSIVLITSINSLRNKQDLKAKEQNAQTILTDSKKQFADDYKLAILYNDKEKARNILDEILTNTKSIVTNDSNIKSEVSILNDQVQVELDNLNNVQRIKNMQLATELPTSSVFSDSHDYIYALNKDSGIVTSSTKTNAHKETINLSSGNKVIAITPSEEKDFSYLLTDKNQLYKVTSPLDQIVEIKSKDDSWKTGVSMSVFATNIYILDANGNQIWKYTNGSDGFSNSQSYLASGVNIGDGVDLTIDGAVYVLKKDGQIIKLSKGRQQDFRISGIPKPDETITNPLRIYTNADANYIYALDGNRLLELEKSGKFSAQYVFDGLNDLKDFSLNTKTKEILLLDGNKIYKGNL